MAVPFLTSAKGPLGLSEAVSYSLKDAENDQCLNDTYRDVVILYTKTICFY